MVAVDAVPGMVGGASESPAQRDGLASESAKKVSDNEDSNQQRCGRSSANSLNPERISFANAQAQPTRQLYRPQNALRCHWPVRIEFLSSRPVIRSCYDVPWSVRYSGRCCAGRARLGNFPLHQARVALDRYLLHRSSGWDLGCASRGVPRLDSFSLVRILRSASHPTSARSRRLCIGRFIDRIRF
jgi:hypothetical protein